MTKQEKQEMCRGCRDDWYNHNRGGCWMLKSARKVKRLVIGVNQMPPYDIKKTKVVLNCYKPQGSACINPKESLTKSGYWR